MKKVTLSNGFECKIDENIINDMRLIDLLAGSKEDGTLYSEVVLMIFGKEQRDSLYKSIATKSGIVPMVNTDGKTYSVTDAVTEVMTAIGPAGKN